MRIIVSFTSYPKRISGVYKVVESLYQQTVRPDEILLYLSVEEFPDMEAGLPSKLRGLTGKNGFRIVWVKGNLKSHKKYYYVLQEYKEDVVITVDDDTVYADSMVSDLMKSYQKYPNAVSARRARIILRNGKTLEPYGKWEKYVDEYEAMPRMDLCAIGVGGICYPPALVNSNWFHKNKIFELAEDQDDLWLKYNEIACGIPVVYTKPSLSDITIENSQAGSLSVYNAYQGNDICIEKLTALMKSRESEGYCNWFQSLMREEEYIENKKSYYCKLFKDAFCKAGTEHFYLYGAGRIAGIILRMLSDFGLINKITAVIVSDKSGNPSELEGVRVMQLEDMNCNHKFGLIFGVNEANRQEIQNMLHGKDYQCIECDIQGIRKYYER